MTISNQPFGSAVTETPTAQTSPVSGVDGGTIAKNKKSGKPAPDKRAYFAWHSIGCSMLCKWRALGIACLTFAAILSPSRLFGQPAIVRNFYTTNANIGAPIWTNDTSVHIIGQIGLQINNSDDLIKIKAVSYNWPTDNGPSGTTGIFRNDGSGVLDWSTNFNSLKVTNLYLGSGLTLSYATASTLPILNGSKGLVSLANAVGMLTNNGSGGFGFTTNLTTDITVNNITTTNLTVQNSITLKGKQLGSTHFNGTNVYPTVNFTNSATVTWAFDGSSNITATASGTTVSVNATNVTTPNLQDSATVTWAKSGSNLIATASASGTTVSVNGTNVSTPNWKDTSDITYALASSTNIQPSFAAQSFNAITFSSSTNLNALDCSLGNSLMAAFKCTLTNSAYFTTPTSVPTTPKLIQIWFIQDSTGTRAVTFTNKWFTFPGGVVPTVDTNANAITLCTFATNPFTNGVLSFVGITPQIQ
jgi:hypothetical protein